MLFERAEGCRVWDLDGREYIDLCASHGAALLGHGDPRVREAVMRTLDRGAACSYENELHGRLAELLCLAVPCLERVRLTGSGSEVGGRRQRMLRCRAAPVRIPREIHLSCPAHRLIRPLPRCPGGNWNEPSATIRPLVGWLHIARADGRSASDSFD